MKITIEFSTLMHGADVWTVDHKGQVVRHAEVTAERIKIKYSYVLSAETSTAIELAVQSQLND